MPNWLAGGNFVYLILVLMVIEAVTLALVWARTARGVPPLSLAVNLAAGACLLLALRAGLAGAQFQSIGIFLALALAAHSADVTLRWQGCAK